MSARNDRVVFDCNIFAQALLNLRGSAGQCLGLARQRQIELFVSEYVLDEVRELAGKLPLKTGITQEDTDDLAQQIRGFATMVNDVPGVYLHPIDADDSEYVNLAVAVDAGVIVSRDNHLLDLMNRAKPWAREFCERFPGMRVLPPQAYLAQRAALRPPTRN